MENKIIPREIEETSKDIHYEYFRTIKTFCVIMIIFCLGLIFKKDYLIMLQKAQNMRFYPESTVFYIDTDNPEKFRSQIKIPNNVSKISYGIFKDANGNKNYLIVTNQSAKANNNITETQEYFFFEDNEHIFYSNNKKELLNLQARIATHDWELIRNKKIKKLLQRTDDTRNSLMFVNDISYTNLSSIVKFATDKLFAQTDVILIQMFNNKDNISFKGELTFKNKTINTMLYWKNLLWHYSNKNIKIHKLETREPVVIIGLNNFDVLIKMIVKIAKNLDNKRYDETMSLIQSVFNSNFEEDIIKNLNGSAVFYLYKNKNIYNNLFIVETKKNLSLQVQKYLNYLQLSDNISLSEKEIKNKTFNVLNSGIGNYSISFGSLNEKSFMAGDQNIMEQYIEAEDNIKMSSENSDIYIETDLRKLPFDVFENNNWSKIKLKLNIDKNIIFNGVLMK